MFPEAPESTIMKIGLVREKDFSIDFATSFEAWDRLRVEQGLGSAFDAELREAWTAAYMLWAETMQAAVQEGDEQIAAA